MERRRTLLTKAYADADAFLRYWAPVLREAGARLVKRLLVDRPKRVLDLGAGAGINLAAIGAHAPGATVVACDYVEPLLRAAPSEYPRVVGDAMRLGFADDSFDGVVMAFMLFHTPEPAEALAETRRILRAGGGLVVGTWMPGDPFAPDDIFEEELNAAGAPPFESMSAHLDLMDSPEKIAALLRAAGFEVGGSAVEEFPEQLDVETFLDRRRRLGGTVRRLGEIDAEARDACLARARERLIKLEAGDFFNRDRAILTWARS